MSLDKSSASYRDIIVISFLIISICFLTFTLPMYLTFHALQWKRALYILELAFPPMFCLGGLAALLVYQRVKARRLQGEEHDPEA